MGLFSGRSDGSSDKEHADYMAGLKRDRDDYEKKYYNALANSSPYENHDANYYRDQAFVMQGLLEAAEKER